MSNHPQHWLTNIPFSLPRKVCNIFENENIKEKRFKELKKKTFLEQKYRTSLIEGSILKAEKLPFEVLRQSKTTKNQKIILFNTTYNLNNRNFFPVIKQSFDNLQYFNPIHHGLFRLV